MKIDKTVIKFAFVGIINTIVGTSIMLLSYNILNLGYWISTALNYICGSIVSYFLNKNYTFNNKKKDKKIIIKFIINIIICYFIAYGVAKPLIFYLLATAPTIIQENIAMFVGMGIFMVLNYFGQKYYTFS